MQHRIASRDRGEEVLYVSLYIGQHAYVHACTDRCIPRDVTSTHYKLIVSRLQLNPFGKEQLKSAEDVFVGSLMRGYALSDQHQNTRHGAHHGWVLNSEGHLTMH